MLSRTSSVSSINNDVVNVFTSSSQLQSDSYLFRSDMVRTQRNLTSGHESYHDMDAETRELLVQFDLNSRFERRPAAQKIAGNAAEMVGPLWIRGMGVFALKGIWEPVPLAEVSVPELAKRSTDPKARKWVTDWHVFDTFLGEVNPNIGTTSSLRLEVDSVGTPCREPSRHGRSDEYEHPEGPHEGMLVP